MITEDYVSFEIAKLLKEKGFNERLLTFYITDEEKKESDFQIMAFTDDKIDNNHSVYCYLAPTLQMAMKWLREIHNLIIYVKLVNDGDLYHDAWGFVIYNKFTNEYIKSNKLCFKYEAAAEAAIKYCLESLI